MFNWLTVGFYFAKSNTFEISLDGNVENNLAIEYTYTLNINIYLFMNIYIYIIYIIHELYGPEVQRQFFQTKFELLSEILIDKIYLEQQFSTLLSLQFLFRCDSTILLHFKKVLIFPFDKYYIYITLHYIYVYTNI